MSAKAKWESTNDTVSVPTGMFKDNEDCAQGPVTFVVSIHNKLGKVMPPSRNPARVRSNMWEVDSKVISVNVGPNADPMEANDPSEIEAISKCVPNQQYMRDNPVRCDFVHFQQEAARMEKRELKGTGRLLQSWFTDNDRNVGGIEVRHCVWWNPDFGPNGAWDPNGCNMLETSPNRSLCACETFGMMAVVLERTERISIDDDCIEMQYVKYVGIAFSSIGLLIMIIATIGSKYIWDMFHVIRMHIGFTWIMAIVLHVVTDMDSIRDNPESNLLVGMFMKYFYTASLMWTVCEAHATFKAFTGGIISGRTKIYFPIGYGTPLIPIGLLFLIYHDDFGVDPRCFVGWNDEAKTLYLLYNFAMSLAGVTLALIILFNVKKPQTKRRNVVADLTSQANGIVAVCFLKMILWIFATVTYLHNQESDMADPYCYFILYLGWFGWFMFLCLGVFSKKWRNGLRGGEKAKAGLIASIEAKQADADEANFENEPDTEIEDDFTPMPAVVVASNIDPVPEEDESEPEELPEEEDPEPEPEPEDDPESEEPNEDEDSE